MTLLIEPGSPSAYAAQKLDDALLWWRGELGALQREVGGILAPGIDPTAWAGFGTNGDPRSAGGTAAFWEIGWGSLPGGTVLIPPPNRDTSVQNTWFGLHEDPRVFASIGRPASMALGAWTQLPDQTALTITDLLDQGYAVSRTMGAAAPRGTFDASRIRADVSGLWFVFLMFGAFSAGAPRWSRHLRPYRDQLAGVPEDGRAGKLIWTIATECAQGQHVGRPGDHDRVVWTVERTWQKIEAARWIDLAMGGDGSFYDLHGDADWGWAQAVITRRAYGYDLAGIGEPDRGYTYRPSALPLTSKLLIGTAGVVVAGMLWNRRESIRRLRHDGR